MTRASRLFGLCVLLAACDTFIVADKPKLVVLTDIGGDRDDQQCMIRLLLHTNQFEIAGLIASAAGVPGELKKETVNPELIREIVEAYGNVRPNMLLHRPDFHDSQLLLERIKSGNPVRGVKSLGAGADHDTDSSRWISSPSWIPAKEANHPPVAILNGDKTLTALEMKVRAGSDAETVGRGIIGPGLRQADVP